MRFVVNHEKMYVIISHYHYVNARNHHQLYTYRQEKSENKDNKKAKRVRTNEDDTMKKKRNEFEAGLLFHSC